MNRRQAKAAANTVEALANKVEQVVEQRQERQADAMRQAVNEAGTSGQTVTLAADEAPDCTKAQRQLVRQKLEIAYKHGVITEVPDVSEISIAQAEALLTALGVDTDLLYKGAMEWGAGKAQKAWKAAQAAG